MATQKSLDKIYMQVALLHASLSRAERKKVGACIVTSTGVILAGLNGTPAGHDNRCEDKVLSHHPEYGGCKLVTKPTTLHAELQCVLKAAKEGVAIVGSTCYITLTPCQQCAAMLCQAGIKRVVYLEEYRDMQGLEVLKLSGIQVDKFNSNEISSDEDHPGSWPTIHTGYTGNIKENND